MNILEVTDLSINFGGVKAVQNVSMRAEKGSITSIIGPNGAGKTTFFNLVSGIYKPTSGKVMLDGEDITSLKQHEISHKGISRTFQNIRLFNQLSNLQNVQSALDARANYNVFEAVLGLPGKRKKDKENRERSRYFLDLVDLGDVAEERPNSLPYGKQRRLELARALASEPKLLMLDEPAAGLNPTEVEEFIELIRKIQGVFDLSILLIEHRLKVVHTLSNHIYVLNFGELLAEGNSEQIQANQEVIAAYMGEDED
ncbi:ABC transporter ATP-binding protein [Ruminococcaceae bacterium OttesenSCG-928-D13]|nr:ABC transporter ATP-binding protein [Ruminococcaceae bacterium OttesenSCG-928-D13]